MGAFVVSDHEATTAKLREVLRQEGQDCPLANVVSLGRAATFLVATQPELVVVALSPDPDRAAPRKSSSNASAQWP